MSRKRCRRTKRVGRRETLNDIDFDAVFPRYERPDRAAVEGMKALSGRFVEDFQGDRLDQDDEGDPLPLRFHLFGDDGRNLVLAPVRTESANRSVDDRVSLIVRTLAHALPAQAVLTVAETWTASRCHECGETAASGARGGLPHLVTWDECPGCGVAAVPPSLNPYHKEAVLGVLETRDSADGFVWWGDMRRDETGTVVGFDNNPVLTTRDGVRTGLFEKWWAIPQDLRRHVMVNLQPALEKVGRTRSRQYAEAVRMARIARTEWPWFPFVTLDFGGYSFIDPTLN